MAIDTPIATRIRVEDYHTMIADGRLTTDDRVELLDGQIVAKMPQNPPHARAISRVTRLTMAAIIHHPEWMVQSQVPITLDTSEPEPDLIIIMAPDERYEHRHPGSTEVALVVEVADSSLDQDQDRKQAIYAQAGLPVYWIINLNESYVEVYTQPVQTPTPHYHLIERFRAGDMLPLMLAGVEVGRLNVRDLLP